MGAPSPEEDGTPLRVWLLSFYLCFTIVLPQVASIFFVNSAYLPVSRFLANITNAQAPENEADAGFLWYLFVNLDSITRASFIFITPLIADYFGRRKCLLLSLFLTVPGNLLLGLSLQLRSWESLFIARCLNTMGRCLSGDILVVVFAEMGSLRSAGRLKSLVTIAISLSVTVASVLGLEGALGTSERWPFAYAAFAFLSALAAPAILWMKETPAFLGRRAKEAPEAFDASLLFYFGSTRRAQAVLVDANAKKTRNGCTAIGKLFTLRRHLAILVALNVATCFSNLLRNFSTEIFANAGLSNAHAGYATSGLKMGSSVALLSTFVLVDRVRRRLHYFVCLGVALGGLVLAAVSQGLVDHGVEGVGPVFVSGLLVTFLGVDVGPRCLLQLISAEIYPHQLRMASRSVSLLLISALGIKLGFAFLPLLSALGWVAYFAVLVAVGSAGVVLWRLLPETAKRETSEIMADLGVPLDEPKASKAKPRDEEDPDPILEESTKC